MLHAYKKGGAWKSKAGQEYTVKTVNDFDVNEFLNDGWSLSLDDALAIEAEYSPAETSDYEAELRAKIKALGGTAASRSKVETLEAQLKALEDDQED